MTLNGHFSRPAETDPYIDNIGGLEPFLSLFITQRLILTNLCLASAAPTAGPGTDGDQNSSQRLRNVKSLFIIIVNSIDCRDP